MVTAALDHIVVPTITKTTTDNDHKDDADRLLESLEEQREAYVSQPSSWAERCLEAINAYTGAGAGGEDFIANLEELQLMSSPVMPSETVDFVVAELWKPLDDHQQEQQQEVAALKQALQDAEEKAKADASKIEEQSREMVAMVERMKSMVNANVLQTELQTLRDKLETSERSGRQKTKEALNMSRDLKYAREQVQTLQRDVHVKAQLSEFFSRELHMAQHSLTCLSADLDMTKRGAASTRESLTKALAEERDKVHKEREKYKMMARSLEESEARSKAIKRAQDDTVSQMAALREELDQAKSALQLAKKDHAHSLTCAQGELQRKDDEVVALRSELDQVKSALQVVSKEAMDRTKDLQAAQCALQEKEDKLAAAKERELRTMSALTFIEAVASGAELDDLTRCLTNIDMSKREVVEGEEERVGLEGGISKFNNVLPLVQKDGLVPAPIKTMAVDQHDDASRNEEMMRQSPAQYKAESPVEQAVGNHRAEYGNEPLVLRIRWPQASHDTPGGPPSMWTLIPLELFQERLQGLVPANTLECFQREVCFLGTHSVYIPLSLLPPLQQPEEYVRCLEEGGGLRVSLLYRHQLSVTIMEEMNHLSQDPMRGNMKERKHGNRKFAIEKSMEMLNLLMNLDGTETLFRVEWPIKEKHHLGTCPTTRSTIPLELISQALGTTVDLKDCYLGVDSIFLSVLPSLPVPTQVLRLKGAGFTVTIITHGGKVVRPTSGGTLPLVIRRERLGDCYMGETEKADKRKNNMSQKHYKDIMEGLTMLRSGLERWKGGLATATHHHE